MIEATGNNDGCRLIPVAPVKSTVTTSPASGIVFIVQVLIEMLPARLGEVLEVLF